MKVKFNPLLITAFVVTCIATYGQKQTYDMHQLLKENKLNTNNRKVIPITDGNKKGISLTGVVWLRDVNFTTGTIEVDLRGKDLFQQSFLGIAFHGVDTMTYDLVYFRPFNFRADDPIRRIHAVQYTSEPDFPWHRLREQQNGVYEKAVEPAPLGTDWFHAKIVVDGKQIKVYVDHATTPSLTVTKLNDRTNGLIGFWNNGLNGEFANLVISR